jgi:DNA-binding MarR family transcriptional regulator
VRRSLPTLAEYRALAELRYQLRAFVSFSERAAREASLEPQHHQLLLAIKGLPEQLRPTIGTLAQRLCVEHHTTVALVDKLVAAQLIRRVPSQRDRREVLLEITAEGEQRLADLSKLHTAQLRTIGPALLAALHSVLRSRAVEARPRARERREQPRASTLDEK